MLTTKAAVEGLVTQAGRAGGSREAPPPAAFVSGRGSGIRASATAGRAERRASAATGGAARVRGQRRVGAPLRLVHRLGGRWAQPLGRPCLRLNAKPPGFCDRAAAAGFVFFAEATTRSRAEEALGTAARLPKMALLRAFPVRLAVPQVRRDSRTTAPSRTPPPRRWLRPADRTNAAIAHLRRPPNANAALCAPQVAVRANAAARMFSTELEAKSDPALTKELNDNMGNAPPRPRRWHDDGPAGTERAKRDEGWA